VYRSAALSAIALALLLAGCGSGGGKPNNTIRDLEATVAALTARTRETAAPTLPPIATRPAPIATRPATPTPPVQHSIVGKWDDDQELATHLEFLGSDFVTTVEFFSDGTFTLMDFAPFEIPGLIGIRDFSGTYAVVGDGRIKLTVTAEFRDRIGGGRAPIAGVAGSVVVFRAQFRKGANLPTTLRLVLTGDTTGREGQFKPR
jgi:hypothetical protein